LELTHEHTFRFIGVRAQWLAGAQVANHITTEDLVRRAAVITYSNQFSLLFAERPDEVKGSAGVPTQLPNPSKSTAKRLIESR
jgi:hypothetical protein